MSTPADASAPAAEPASASAAAPAAASASAPERVGRAVRPEAPYGFPAPLWKGLARIPVPPPLSGRTWRSPLRGPWLTSVFGFLLLVGLPIVILTGLLSYIAYQPQYGTAFPGDVGYLHLPYFDWPAGPSWLYRLNQGLHVVGGTVLVPVVLAKLWSVVPKLFEWPPVRSPAQLLERVSLLALVGGILFEMVTGLMNSQYDYAFGFSFYTGHYYGAWVFIAGFVVHVLLKFPTMVRSLRGGSLRRYLRDSTEETEPEPLDVHGLVAESPSRPTMSRRTLLGVVGGGSVFVGALTIGSTWDALRPLALLSPRGQSYGDGPTDFQVNRTAFGAGISPAVGDGWALQLTGGPAPVTLTKPDLIAMGLHTATLPIACVEGWSTTQVWTGVRLRDLAARAGVPAPDSALVTSLEGGGAFSRAVLNSGQVLAGDALLALQVNGADLSLDHGFPARVIVPALPGVHNTKWVGAIEFRAPGPGAA